MATIIDSEFPATEPIPTISTRPRWRDTFSSLAIRNYRLYVFSQVVSNTTVWMQRIAIDWLVLELTGNVALVGVVVALQFSPILFFGAWGGVIADRYSKRRLLITVQSIVAVLCAALAALTITGVVSVWHVFVIAFVLGMASAVDGPARAAFVTEMVGNAHVRNAISVNASIFHLGGLVGPALSGLLIVAVGSGWSIGINAVATVMVVCALAAMRASELRPAPRSRRSGGQIRQALRYAASKPPILWSLVTLSFVSTFGMSLPVLLTGMANDVYETGATGYGLYNSLAAVGALTGAVLSTRRTTLRLRGIVLGAIVFGLVTTVAGFAPSVGVFFVALVGIGLTRLLFATSAESMTQLSSNVGIRGRVMSLYIMVLLGGQAIGGPVMGWIAETWGAQTGFAVAGIVPTIAGIVIAVILARSGQLKLRVDLWSAGPPISIVKRAVRRRPADARPRRGRGPRGRGARETGPRETGQRENGSHESDPRVRDSRR
ncbi:MFS transporter [Marisediminicola sp. LYQ134]|uniref:MFS transporter n=1 Tax=Marisediminicola sp. LYQ134 TaxID=3391061 RepID=UPI003982E9CC